MFVLNPAKPVSMGLRKMTVDYVYMGDEPSLNELPAEEKLIMNTSGMNKGIRDKLLRPLPNSGYDGVIYKWLMAHPKISLGPDEVYARLIEKLEKEKDYDPDESMSLEGYCIQMWFFLRSEILQELKNPESNANLEQFISEDEKRSDESIKVSTEDLLYKQGHYQAIEDRMTDEEARHKLVELLATLKSYQDAIMTTKENHINAIRIIQARIAHDHFLTEQERMMKKTKGEIDSQVVRVKQSKELIVSYGGKATSNIKNGLKRALAEHYVSDKEGKGLLHAWGELMKVCDHLEIPIIELNDEEIMNDDYIRDLYLALKHKKTVCVSEYDLEEFESNLTAIDMKEAYIKDELLKNDVPNNRIAHYFNTEIMSKIYRIKMTDLRRLDNIVDKIKQSHEIYMNEFKFAGLKEREKNTKEIKSQSKEHLLRLKQSRTTILRGYSTKDDKPVLLTGPFSAESLSIIEEATNNYFSQLLVDNPEALKLYYKFISKKYIEPRSLTVDGNGFLKEKNGLYFQLAGDVFHRRNNDKSKEFLFNKWLVNERGFIVAKFLDAEVEVGENIKVYRAPSKYGYGCLIIKDVLGNIILDGYKG